VFSLATDFAGVAAAHGLEARATTAKMAVPRWYFAQLNMYGLIRQPGLQVQIVGRIL
jgi:hypothetical protein